jgi:hypothetical protein
MLNFKYFEIKSLYINMYLKFKTNLLNLNS